MKTIDAYLDMLLDDAALQASVTMSQMKALRARLAVVVDAVRSDLSGSVAPVPETASAAPAVIKSVEMTREIAGIALGQSVSADMVLAQPEAGPFVCAADGACSGNGTEKASGGWGVVFSDGRSFGGMDTEPGVTNNRMEMSAAIVALAAVAPGSSITVICDSEYVVQTMSGNWRRKKNHDLWEKLDELAAQRNVTWAWTKGHTGVLDSQARVLNDKADRLAQSYAQRGRS